MRNKTKDLGLLFIILISVSLVISLISLNILILVEEDNPPQIDTDTIVITNDSDFTEKYHFNGSGTIEDPYLIQNLEITNQKEYGISIVNTTVYFEIRNCTIITNGTGINIDKVAPNTCNISENTCVLSEIGISVSNTDYCLIKNNNCNYNIQGITLYSSAHASILSNYCANNTRYNYEGITCLDCPYSNIINNQFEDTNGISVSSSEYSIINNNSEGYIFATSSNMQICYNEIRNNEGGIYSSSGNSLIYGNYFHSDFSNYITISYNNNQQVINNSIGQGGFVLYESSANMGTLLSHTFENNTVGSKPIAYVKSKQNYLYNDSSYAQIFLINCTNIAFENISFSNVPQSIRCYYCSEIQISHCNFSNIRYHGVGALRSNKINISNNYFSECSNGIHLDNSDECNIINNYCFKNGIGIYTFYSQYTLIESNLCFNNSRGIHSQSDIYSGNSIIRNNTCWYNSDEGLQMMSYYSTVENNSYCFNRIGMMVMTGYTPFRKNICNNNSFYGIELFYALDCHVNNNTSNFNNIYGFHLWGAHDNFIYFNLIEGNLGYGIFCNSRTENNIIYLNDFINNNDVVTNTSRIQAYDVGESNLFYSAPLLKGNYWSDLFWYMGATYKIDGSSNYDLYPLEDPIY